MTLSQDSIHLNLLTDAWIPVFIQGTRKRVTIAEAMDLPVISVQTGRQDFNFAIFILLIGLTQTSYKPDPLLGEGPRFLQNHNAISGSQRQIGGLLLDEPGAQTIKENRDHFVKREQRQQMCVYCATIALYTQTQFCPGMGAGYYPSNLFHSALYLIEKPIIRDLITANVLSDQVIDASAYFGVPNHYWLDNPEAKGECKLCGEEGPVISHYWTKSRGEKPSFAPSLHAAKTRNDKRYAVGVGGTLLDLMEGVAPGSAVAKAPMTIGEEGILGTPIWCFNTFYDNAALRTMHSVHFKLRRPTQYAILNLAVRAIFKVQHPNMENYIHSMLAHEIRGNMAELILDKGMTETEAALNIYIRYALTDDTIQKGEKFRRYQYYHYQIAKTMYHSMVYKVYLKCFNERGHAEVDSASRTETCNPEAAEVAFRELINRKALIGQNIHVVLSLNNKPLMYHRYDRQPGDEDYVAPDAPIKLTFDEHELKAMLIEHLKP